MNRKLLENHTYKVVKIENAEDALRYVKECPLWCISYDAACFRQATLDGQARCVYYFRDDYRKVEEVRGANYPYDDYGLSVICVIRDKDGKMINCTSRWNDVETESAYLTEEDLKFVRIG